MAESSDHSGGGNSQSQVIQVPEPQPHPVMEQLPDVEYCINSPPPWPHALLLGFQHYILTLGMTVLIPTTIVPEMGGGHAEKAKVIQNLLFVSGLSTLLQTWFGTRLPTVVVGSYSYIIPAMSIIHAKRYTKYTDPYERFTHTIRGIQGALIISSIFHVCMGFLGIWRFAVRFLSPLSVVPFVTFTGLGLYHLGFPMLANCVEVGLPALIVMVFISQAMCLLSTILLQYLNRFISTKRLIYERYGLLFSIASAWLLAQLLTSSTAYNNKPESTQNSCRTDRSGLISASEWFHIPFIPFPWGFPTFNFGEALAMIAASFVTLFESTGTFFAAARYGSGTPVPPHIICRGTGWVGVASMVNGFLGSVTGCTASVENAGLLALTKVGSRRVIQISAGFMVFFSIAGKFGAVLASIPLPIMAAMNCLFFGYVSSAGLDFLQFCNLNSFRIKFVLGLSFFLGISIPQYFVEYFYVKHHHGWFNDILNVFFMSHTTVAVLVAFILDITLSRDDDEVRKDIGLQWWEKFRVYSADGRNADFYKLPCRLNEFFPAL
ncbi:Putative nucleobase-ascorbate transporter 10 [Glycine soja]|uniref:Putative nucleobase-ascorbate transporter 10 n=1 Tax=Glycine soja TaxID=3848 RepID=A0A0B2SJW4_GLYSO|nr:Putative nucleobase-ascorbate transporter 10 [Glycine soja]